MSDPHWTFTVKIAAPTKDPTVTGAIDYTPQEWGFILDSAAYWLTRALIDFKEFAEEDEDALKACLTSKIETVTDAATWQEKDAEVTVRRVG